MCVCERVRVCVRVGWPHVRADDTRFMLHEWVDAAHERGLSTANTVFFFPLTSDAQTTAQGVRALMGFGCPSKVRGSSEKANQNA